VSIIIIHHLLIFKELRIIFSNLGGLHREVSGEQIRAIEAALGRPQAVQVLRVVVVALLHFAVTHVGAPKAAPEDANLAVLVLIVEVIIDEELHLRLVGVGGVEGASGVVLGLAVNIVENVQDKQEGEIAVRDTSDALAEDLALTIVVVSTAAEAKLKDQIDTVLLNDTAQQVREERYKCIVEGRVSAIHALLVRLFLPFSQLNGAHIYRDMSINFLADVLASLLIRVA